MIIFYLLFMVTSDLKQAQTHRLTWQGGGRSCEGWRVEDALQFPLTLAEPHLTVHRRVEVIHKLHGTATTRVDATDGVGM